MEKTIELKLTDSEIKTLIFVLSKLSDLNQGEWDPIRNEVKTVYGEYVSLSDFISKRLDYLH